ncbi:MAG: hypothetical protein JRF63_02070 [Deltaproteobacteria bacterium]|nr:hypothetical protein [Deltaproteobacteria bacterium]
MDAATWELIQPIWWRTFLFTLAVEVPLFVLVARLGADCVKISPIVLACAGAMGTCVTHPLLWFVWPHAGLSYTTYIISGELIVAVVETFTFFAIARPIRFSRAIAASFIANAGSYGLGALLQGLGWMGQ